MTVVKDVTREGKVTNTITRDTGRLKLVKNVNGGSKTANDWTLTATGPNSAPNVSNKGGQGSLTSVWSNVDYTLAESRTRARTTPPRRGRARTRRTSR